MLLRKARWLVLLPALTVAGVASSQTAPPAAPAAAPTMPADHELIYQGQATSILGRTLRDPAGESIGRIVDVLVDELGMPRAAVIDFGGFMGVGNRRVAVTWRAMRFLPAAERGQIVLDMTADQIKAIPDYKRSAGPTDPPVAVAVPPPPVEVSHVSAPAPAEAVPPNPVTPDNVPPDSVPAAPEK